MRKIVILLMLVASFVVLQSFQSCHEELFYINIENSTEDTIYSVVRAVFEDDTYLNRFWAEQASIEWRKVAPKSTASLFRDYGESIEIFINPWKVWCIKKKDMAGMTLEEVINNNLVDSLCSLIRVYTYEDLKKINFCIKVY